MTPWCPASRQALLALLFSLLSLGYSLDVNGLEGGKIALKPIYSGTAHGYVWKQGNNKIVEIDILEPPIYYRDRNKYDLNISTGVLTIMDLRGNDEAKYVAEVLINNVYSPTTFDLHVFPNLNKPEVSCDIRNTDVTLWCRLALDSSKGLRYRWDIRPIEQTHLQYNSSDDNKTLTVINAKRNSLKSLDCIVNNPATENRTSVSLACFPEERPLVPPWLIALIIIIFVVIPAFMLLTYCIWKHGFLEGIFTRLGGCCVSLCQLCKRNDAQPNLLQVGPLGNEHSGGHHSEDESIALMKENEETVSGLHPTGSDHHIPDSINRDVGVGLGNAQDTERDPDDAQMNLLQVGPLGNEHSGGHHSEEESIALLKENEETVSGLHPTGSDHHIPDSINRDVGVGLGNAQDTERDQSIAENKAPGKEPSEDRAQTPKDPSASAAHEGSQEKLNNQSTTEHQASGEETPVDRAQTPTDSSCFSLPHGSREKLDTTLNEAEGRPPTNLPHSESQECSKVAISRHDQLTSNSDANCSNEDVRPGSPEE